MFVTKALNFNRLFVAKLPYRLNNEGLLQHFSKFGAVSDAYVVRDRETRKSRGFGFVTFEKESDAEACISDPAAKKIVMEDGQESPFELVVNEAADSVRPNRRNFARKVPDRFSTEQDM
eukprot:Nk52_evm17s233 gene=Nk52_evmTU17s233